jgi:hypothetical protein
MRINFKKGLIGFILFSFTITAIAALIISINYSTSYIYTLKVFKRKIQLELISLGIRLYDPIESIRSNTGEELFNKTTASLYNREKKKLLAILKRMIDTKKEGSVSIDLYDNQHITRSKYEFGYAPFNERRRLQFVKIFHAESSLVSDNDFSVILNLRNYVKSLWQHGQDKGFNPDRFDAIEITKNAKMGRKYWCHVYSLTFIQIASSVGITSRLVTLSDDGYEKDHAVVEVWSNYYKKWIIMDVDYNIHYTRIGDEIPLNAVELHNAFMEDKIDGIAVIKGKPRPVGYEVEGANDKLLNLYKYIYTTQHYFGKIVD